MAHEDRGKRCGVLFVKRMRRQHSGEPNGGRELAAHDSENSGACRLVLQTLSLAGYHEEGAANALWAKKLEVAARAVSHAFVAVGQAHSRGAGAKARHTAQMEVEQHALEWLAAAERRGDLLVHLRVGGSCRLSALISRDGRAMLGRACAF